MKKVLSPLYAMHANTVSSEEVHLYMKMEKKLMGVDQEKTASNWAGYPVSSGYDVSISSNGMIVAVGSPGNEGASALYIIQGMYESMPMMEVSGFKWVWILKERNGMMSLEDMSLFPLMDWLLPLEMTNSPAFIRLFVLPVNISPLTLNRVLPTVLLMSTYLPTLNRVLTTVLLANTFLPTLNLVFPTVLPVNISPLTLNRVLPTVLLVRPFLPTLNRELSTVLLANTFLPTLNHVLSTVVKMNYFRKKLCGSLS